MAQLIVTVLVQLASIPLVFKTWKKDVWDYFIDTTGFFVYYAMTPALLRQWTTLVNAVATSERDKVSDLLARITTASPSNLFVNREAEAITKALYLRKLAFVLFSGAQDQYLPLLPTVQEKLVELLKMPQLSTLVHIEVYLCLRVLLCRVSGRYLSNFWPVLLTDIMSQFTSILAEKHEPSLDQISLFLAMCKFLDLLLTLETGEFQHHQWMFITDTIDALYGTRSDSYALLDRMSDQLLTFGSNQAYRKGKSPIGSPTHPKRAMGTTSATQSLASSSTAGKRPLITAGAITSLQELEPFIHNISLHTYQATYSLSQPDTAYIEEWLVRDLIFTTIYGNPSVAPAGTRHSATGTRPFVLNDIVSGL
ncbi:hypothetical protein H4R34_004454 [Dimargaris verticillata]|uniref:DOP1-like C-terminal domain-containing protein n=1 Tax=Dimargaris verticillata TaxID=2761393 RepID=A0A9W8B050_9FUNG|nr:hypothetical protein H4R34_004454 [Dimargaris verticillata]